MRSGRAIVIIAISSMILGTTFSTQSENSWKDPSGRWTYNLGGSDWSQIKQQCGSPLAQSPVDIPQTSRSDSIKVTIDWADKDQTVPIRFKQGSIYSPGKFSTIKLKNPQGLDVHYQSTYIQYHAPGENKLQGDFYDLELLIYHTIHPDHITRTMIQQAVISVLFRKSYETQQNPFLLSWNVGSLDVPEDYQQIQGQATINIKTLADQLAANTDVYNFLGSYTRPPCNENMNWFVFDQVLQANYQQLNELNKFFRLNNNFAGGRGNAREIQDFGTRQIAQINAQFAFVSDQSSTNLLQKQAKQLQVIQYDDEENEL